MGSGKGELRRRGSLGDVLGPHTDDIIRIATKNIGGLKVVPGNDKEDELKNWIVKKEIDIVGIQEVNINWKNCRGKHSLAERMKTPAWEFVKTAKAYNKHDIATRSQCGGTMMICRDQITHQMVGSGADEKGIGRWSWMLFKEEREKRTRIITVYQPNKTNDPMKSGTPYQQQKRFLLNENIDLCPNEVLRKDLIKQITKWMNKGDRIIVMVDCNEDVRQGKLTQRLEEIGLRSPIRQKFGESNMPATYHAGIKPIDDIFISKDLTFRDTGYLPFGDGPGDHRGIYVDIDRASMIGKSIYKIHRQQGRKLKSTDVRTV